jgi:hypothetical protein
MLDRPIATQLVANLAMLTGALTLNFMDKLSNYLFRKVGDGERFIHESCCGGMADTFHSEHSDIFRPSKNP